MDPYESTGTLTLREARVAFTTALADLIHEIALRGYEAALAEGMDRKTTKDPTTDHMLNSLHEIGLAQDIDLYLDGTYLSDTVDHTQFGLFWEELGVTRQLPLTWGGRWGDGNHYSLRWQGRR